MGKNLGGPGNDRGWAAQQTIDGGYIVAEHANSGAGDVGGNNGANDQWMIKLDATGGIEWEQNYGGPGLDRNRSCQQTAD